MILPDLSGIAAIEDNDPPEEMFEKRNQAVVNDVCERKAEAESTEELISVLTEEVKRCMNNEVIDGRDSILDIQVLDIDEIIPYTHNDALSISNQKYMAKIKLSATLLVPITVQSRKEMDEDECSVEKNEFVEQVPESYYIDFRCLKHEADFSSGQVWVSYRCKDGMPRDFLQIKKVTSSNPFRVQVAILEPIDIAFSELSTCGYYRASDTLRIIDDIATFSHMVAYQKAPKGLIRICPAKGQVWTLFKGWNNINDFIGKIDYEIVTISSVNEHGISVIPLVGYGKCRKTVYIEQSEAVFEVAKQDLIKFSYEIPAYKVRWTQSTTESFDGCYELDPAAIPPELLCT